MKRSKMLAVVSVLVGLMLLSSCSMIPASKLEALFSTGTESVITSGMTAAAGESDKDTVMISREDYEKYQRFSEMMTIFDAARQNFYQETDDDKMIEYATRGLMAGLDDPYSFYYNPKEFADMW